MVDLETLGQGQTAAIVSIGAVTFEPTTGKIGSELYVIVDAESAGKYGQIDASTVSWWMQQSEDAREVFSAKKRKTLEGALDLFTYFVEMNTDRPRVWGNGASFDNVILGNAYRATGKEQPWKYYNDLDVRTVVALGKAIGIDPKKTMKREGTHHNALEDARFQAKYVSKVWQALV